VAAWGEMGEAQWCPVGAIRTDQWTEQVREVLSGVGEVTLTRPM